MPASRSARNGCRIVAAEEDARIHLPRSDIVVTRAGHSGEALRGVIEVVDGPGREQLAHRDLAEGWMQAAAIEIRLAHELLEPAEVVRPERSELGDELVELNADVPLQHREPLERLQSLRRDAVADPRR